MTLTDSGERELRGAVQRLEKNLEELRVETRSGFSEIKKAIRGDIAEGTGGLMERVNRNEAIVTSVAGRVSDIEDIVAVHDRWIEDRKAQWRLVVVLSSGNILAMIYMLYRLSEIAANAP